MKGKNFDLPIESDHFCQPDVAYMWRQEMELYINLAMNKAPEKEKCSAFLYVIGRKGREIFNTWKLEDDEKDKITVLFDKFEGYCKPKQNVTLERFTFNTRNQQETETLDQYLTALRLLSKRCQYNELEDETVKSIKKTVLNS